MEEGGLIPVGPPVRNPTPSYWQDPRSALANRVEPKVDKTTKPYDYAIIGSGISGTLIAYNILKRNANARVVMVEAREACSGATGRNGGHTKAASYRNYMQHVAELGKEEALKIARLEYANIIETHRLARELDINCESHMCDTIDMIYDAALFSQGKAAIQALRADATLEERQPGNMAWYEIHDKSSALQSFPISPTNDNPLNPSPEELTGAFSYLAGRIHAYLFTTGVLKACVEKGLDLCTNTPVHAITSSHEHTPNNAAPLWTLSTHHHHHAIHAQTVILATNGYTPYLVKSTQGSIIPLRGQVTAQRPGNNTSTLPSPLKTTYSFIYKTGYEYMIARPLPDGGIQDIIIGGGLGRVAKAGATEYGTVDDSKLDADISRYLATTLTGYFGSQSWDQGAVVQEWSGIMGVTADERPFVGQVPGSKGMWVSAGFNGHGMVLCLKSAEALVGMMMDGGGRVPEWFPRSFLMSEERLKKSDVNGTRDMQSML